MSDRRGIRRRPVGAAKSEICHRVADRPPRREDAATRNHCECPRLEPITLGLRERPVRTQGADFIAGLGALIVAVAKDQFRSIGLIPRGFRRTSPFLPKD